MAEAEFFNDWLRQRLAEAEVKKPHLILYVTRLRTQSRLKW